MVKFNSTHFWFACRESVQLDLPKVIAGRKQSFILIAVRHVHVGSIGALRPDSDRLVRQSTGLRVPFDIAQRRSVGNLTAKIWIPWREKKLKLRVWRCQAGTYRTKFRNLPSWIAARRC